MQRWREEIPQRAGKSGETLSGQAAHPQEYRALWATASGRLGFPLVTGGFRSYMYPLQVAGTTGGIRLAKKNQPTGPAYGASVPSQRPALGSSAVPDAK